MKKFTLLTLLALSILGIGNAQKDLKTIVQRCGTMEALNQSLSMDPEFKARWEKGIRDYEQSLSLGRTTEASRTSALTGPVTIPVVVHVVLPNPDVITEAAIDYFLNRLNLDFSGLNPDSTNGAPFYSVRGHSLMRFVRAKRSPTGGASNGVERRVGSVGIAQTTYQAIKHTSAGGLDPWDVTQYYNLWVGVGAGGLLGIAPTIGVGNQTETTGSNVGIDGVCVDYTAFSNSCFAIPQFNLGRTAVHEIGHNFGLYHINGDAACGADFKQIIGTCQLPATLLAGIDDTPLQSALTSGCPSGNATSGCTGTPLGKMYQNYMDYTDDACYSMFSKGQVERMHWVLENCRPGYLTTLGGTAPAGAPALDASPLDVVSPGGSDFNNTTCTITNYANLTCPGAITPRLRFRNNGTTTLTSVRVGFSLNGTIQEQTVTVSLPTGYTSVVAFNAVNVPAGVNVLKFWTANPNGTTPDAVPANDTLTVNLNVGVGITPPITQDFSSTTFPPPGWSLARVAGATTTAAWQRAAATLTGAPGSAIANFWALSAGNVIDLRSPIVATALTDTMVIRFDVAHQQYNAVQDTLKLMVSPDCGNTFIQIWQEWSSQLSVSGSSAAQLTAPTAAQWKNVTVKIPNSPATQNLLSNPNLLFAWRAVSRFGNNIFLDNINITKIFIARRDLQPLRFTAPVSRLCDGNAVKPIVQVRNAGADTIRSFKANYQVNGGTVTTVNWTGSVAKDQTTTVDLNTANFTPGVYTIKMWTSEPNGLVDQVPTNDTITYSFRVLAITQAPLVEGFEGTFPPANWEIEQQPVDAFTWQKTTTAARTGTASAFISNYNYPASGRVDNLITPPLRYSGADSLFFRFDVAATTYSYPGSTATPLDTLEVLMSTDCGTTFNSVYKKWGAELQTIGDPNNSNSNEFFPTSSSMWRSDSINVTNMLGSANTVRFMFKNTTNFENNIFIDNVNFTPKVLPAKLKANGFMITPSPFSTSFYIQHYLPPTDLRGMGVFNSVGQRVLSMSFNGQADSYMRVDMGRLPAGIYTVKLMYTNRTVSQKVVKLN